MVRERELVGDRSYFAVVVITNDKALAAQALREGKLVALPTETVYGLAADASNAKAVQRIFSVKGRPANHPLIVHIANADQISRWARDVPAVAYALADAFWPGPLTMLLWRHESVCDEVTGGRDTIGLRVPDHELTLSVLQEFGGAVAAPSANRFGKVSPTTAAHVEADLGSEVDVILDGGACTVGVESTIVDLTAEQPTVLRLGAITIEQLADVLGVVPVVHVPHLEADAKAPGMLASHYSPAARVVLASSESLEAALLNVQDENPTQKIAVLAPQQSSVLDQVQFADIVELEPAGDADHYANVLYDRLRLVDRLGIDIVICVPPTDSGIGQAVRDRLQRAANK